MAVVDFFLKLTGIDGEAKDKTHKNEIQLESWSWSEQQEGSGASGGGSGAGKVSGGDFHFTMKVNKASPKLFLACANGEHLTEGTLVARKAGKEQLEFLKIKLSEILVSSYQTGGSGSSDIVPIDQISLNFAKMEMEYKEQTETGTGGGSTKANWDFKQNTGS
jgi:type VI secretion system secreted protein Hcp